MKMSNERDVCPLWTNSSSLRRRPIWDVPYPPYLPFRPFSLSLYLAGRAEGTHYRHCVPVCVCQGPPDVPAAKFLLLLLIKIKWIETIKNYLHTCHYVQLIVNPNKKN